MYGSDEAFPGARRTACVGAMPAAFAACVLVGSVCAADAEARPIAVVEEAADTVRPPYLQLFERRVLFSPEYLSRVVGAAQRRETLDPAVVVAPPPEEGRAAAYARRYNIPAELAMTIIEAALAEGVDPELGFRLVRVESVFRTNARGPGGSLGLTQLMPSTARAVDRSLRTEAEILEPRTNLQVGFRYLRRMIDRYDGDVRLGLLAYNRGQTAVDRALRAGRDPENGYSPKVLGSGQNRYNGTGMAARR